MTSYAHPSDLMDLVAELDGPEDPEHPDICVADESRWAPSAFPRAGSSGRTQEDAEDAERACRIKSYSKESE